LVTVEFSTIDSLPARVDIANLKDITDVEADSPSNLQVLKYNSSTGYWENVSITSLLEHYTKIEEPTKITAKRFQTSQKFISGSLSVSLNGLIEKNITIINSNIFELPIDSIVSDTVECRYIKQP